ncbi:MAG TPA: ABC transporter permease [Acidimicrobiia bacterium]|nr:ABC transporter permease [Acidimicrobiia bacterium]
MGTRRIPWWRRLSPGQRTALVLAEFVVLGLLWELVVGRLELINPLFAPPPSEIFSGLRDLVVSGEIFPHLATSAYEWVVGFLAAVVVGVISGFLLGRWIPFERLAGPVIWLIYAAPWVAFQPLFTVWFGFGTAAVIFLVFTAAVFPILFNTAAGARDVDRATIDCVRVFGFRGLSVYRAVIVPATFPFIVVGLRHGVVIANIGLLVGEITGATKGLGALIALKTAQFQVGATFAILLISVLFTTLMSQILLWIGRRSAPWYFESNGAG